MELGPESYLVKIWYVAWEGGDWMASIWKDTLADAEFKLEYRFRYYGTEHVPGGDPFTDEDRKSWYSGTVKAPEDEAVQKMDLTASLLAAARAAQHGDLKFADSLDVRGGVEAFAKLATKSRKPWLHTRRMNQ